MLDKLGSFRSHAITEIQTLVGAQHAFCRWADTSDYIAELLENDKFLCDDIENVSNKRHHHRGFAYGLTNYI